MRVWDGSLQTQSVEHDMPHFRSIHALDQDVFRIVLLLEARIACRRLILQPMPRSPIRGPDEMLHFV